MPCLGAGQRQHINRAEPAAEHRVFIANGACRDQLIHLTSGIGTHSDGGINSANGGTDNLCIDLSFAPPLAAGTTLDHGKTQHRAHQVGKNNAQQHKDGDFAHHRAMPRKLNLGNRRVVSTDLLHAVRVL